MFKDPVSHHLENLFRTGEERNWVRCIGAVRYGRIQYPRLRKVYHKVDRSDKHGPGGRGYTVCGINLCEEDKYYANRPRRVRMCLRCRKARNG